MNTATSNATLDPPSGPRRKRLLAFEVEVEGHHADYALLYSKILLEAGFEVRFVVTPKFFKLHDDIVQAIRGLHPEFVSIVSLSDEESERMERISYLRYFYAWSYFCKYSRQFDADHAMVMYYDFFQLPMLTGKHPCCPFSAIYFRPTFHYHTLANYRQTWREWFRAKRKEVLLRRVVKYPELSTLLCLDEIAAEYIRNHFSPTCRVQHIADAFDTPPRDEQREDEIRQELGIAHGRKVFCLQGVLDKRKGIKELLECLRLINDEDGRRICILLLGRLQEYHRAEIHALAKDLCDSSSVQIILRDEWISGSVQHYYRVADIILATYQGHMGSSSALIRAALAGKPVLSSDYGLMGAITERHQLGVTVDTTNPRAMADALVLLSKSSAEEIMDFEQAKKFAAQNSTKQLVADLSRLVS